MRRKHVVFFTFVVLASVVALIAFQMMDDGGLTIVPANVRQPAKQSP